MHKIAQIIGEQNRTEPTVYLELRSRAYQKLHQFIVNLSAYEVPEFIQKDIADSVIEDISKATTEEEIETIFKNHKIFS